MKCGKPTIILALKVNDTADNAIRQIKQKNYMQRTEEYKEVLLVGISYSKKEKKHQCLIERQSI